MAGLEWEIRMAAVLSKYGFPIRWGFIAWQRNTIVGGAGSDFLERDGLAGVS